MAVSIRLILVVLILCCRMALAQPAEQPKGWNLGGTAGGPRVDLSLYRTPGGTLQAVYTLSQGPGPFALLDPLPGATFCGPNRWIVPVGAGLPSLRFCVGNTVHKAFPVTLSTTPARCGGTYGTKGNI